ncbi:collagen-like protein [Tateyamaria sp. SN6-1]|uniref:collagen-like triple helix repeat-containing protein n=1 Tax=Tateyamaria sp. SN6-1 TaxID=3092148 RepID=UPI0039F607AB
MEYNEVQAVVDPILSTGDAQLSIGQEGPEELVQSKIFVKRLDVHDVVTITHPDGPENPVAVLCERVFFHSKGMIQSDSEIIFFADYAEGYVSLQNCAGQHAVDMEPISGIPDTVPGAAAQGAQGANGRSATQDWLTFHSARSGQHGGPGANGAEGRVGFTTQNKADGSHARDITIFVKAFHPSSILEINARGGDGGDGATGGIGGKGQTGGTGGTGGRGGNGAHWSPAKRGGNGGAGGNGGRGGRGGQGGPGGDGGNGGDVLIYALNGNSLGIIEIINNSGGKAGVGGQGGDGGQGGEPGARGHGGTGGDGSAFRTDGPNGLAGSFGARGNKGPQGPRGDDGSKGIDGDINYEPRKVVTHVEPEVAKTVADRVAALAA